MGKGLLITLIILVVLVIGGYFGYSYFIAPRVISENTENVLTCSDTDGNDIYTKGSTSLERDEPGDSSRYESSDSCDYYHPKTDSRVGVLREGWCEGNVYKEIKTTCGWGYVCRQGACIKADKDFPICVDSDGGKDINKVGSIIGYGGTGSDMCWMSTSDNKEEGTHGHYCTEESISLGRCYVYEYFCNNDMKAYEIIKCPDGYGCLSGKCIEPGTPL